MVETFVGTWKMTNSENFDEYMKALGMINYLITSKYFQFAKCIRKVKLIFLVLTYALNIILVIVINIKLFRE